MYLNGELDPAPAKPSAMALKGLDLGVAVAPGGTRGSFCELRVWNVARSADEIAASFRRTFAGEKIEHLILLATGDGPWGKLSGAARVVRTLDAPVLLDAAAQAKLDGKFARFKSFALLRGDARRGAEVFAATCMSCHALHGEGAKIGPPLDGVGLRSIDSLLRAVLTPSAAVESGYRLLRVETTDGERLEGLLASQDEHAIVLRRQGREDLSIERTSVRRMAFDSRSVMPDGLLESLPTTDVTALFAYIATRR
jgi:putative heme-binding domain-containing protein